MPVVSLDQIRQVMVCDTDSSDSDSDSDETTRPAAGRRAAARGASSRQQGQRARAAAHGGDGSRMSQTEDRIDKRLLFLKRVHGGTLPTFDDQHPDPGCAFETMWYRGCLDPVFVPKAHEKLQLHMAHQYDPEMPHIRRLFEETREAHWKLTAPKGFASLKGIPELQQLLVYTAADVVHYAVDSQGLGQPGSFEGQYQHEHYSVVEATEGLDSHVLYSKESLIGQLAPGLRLCLAADVATGMLCDSQPLPPDTPQHASALLLFLAAALKQVEEECLRYAKPLGMHWASQSSATALKPLLELCMCLDPQIALQLLQQIAASGAGSGSDGGSSGSSSEGVVGSSGSSHFCPHADPPRDWAQSNVLLAALEVSLLLRQGGRSSSTTSSHVSDLAPAGEESSSSIGSVSLRFAGPALQPLVQKLVQQQQQQEHTAGVAGAVQSLVQLIDGFLSQYVSSPAPCADQTDAAAAGAAAEEPGAAGAAPEEPAAASAGSVHSCSGAAAADDVAWQVSVLTGAAALALLAPPCGSPEQQRQQQQEQQEQAPTAALPGLCPVRVALLFTAIEGLYFRVRQTLLLGVSGSPCACTCSKCTARAQCSAAAFLQQKLRSDITSQILSVLQLAQGLHMPDTRAAGGDGSSSGSSGSSGSQQQQRWRQRWQEQLRHFQSKTTDRAKFAAALKQCTLKKGLSAAQHTVLHELYGLGRLSSWTALTPHAWLSDLFHMFGSEQLSPVCLQQGAAAGAAAAVGAVGVDAAGDAAEEADGLEENRAAWAQLQRLLAAKCCRGFIADLKQRQAAAGGSMQHNQQPQQQGSLSAGGGDDTGSAAAAASQQPASHSSPSHAADFIFEVAVDGSALLSDLTGMLLLHQRGWVKYVQDLSDEDSNFNNYEGLVLEQKQRERDRLLAAEAQEPGSRSQRGSKQSDEDLMAKLEDHLFRPLADRSIDSSSKGSSSGGREQAGSREQAQSPPDGCTQGYDRTCPVCAAEQKAGGLIAELAASREADSSSSSSSSPDSSSGSSPKASTGLYDSFPVHWSDPYLMRRLLWDLLGRVKPTAQAWFRKHAGMCPHRISIVRWHAVALSLARHLWAPPGPWGPQQQQQVALLLPRVVRCQRSIWSQVKEDATARRQYARWCNAGFAHQGSNGAAAAVLSLQALLSLDPHGGRVQPRPELLFYTPAGFHAAVVKTLMQALRLPPSLLPAGQGCELADNTAAGAPTDEGSSSEQAGNQQQEEQQQQELADGVQHYLQAWGDTLFPAWYLWWHIGLLAYHQHQQQQQQQPKQARAKGTAGAAGSSAACVSPPVSPATPQLPAVVGAPALPGAAGGKGGSSGSSSVGGGGCRAVSMQELYNNPDARLFAVGYAARHITSGAQLQRLLSNPPLARALQWPVSEWVIEQKPPEDGCCCSCGVPFTATEDSVSFYCPSCTANTCSLTCSEEHNKTCAVHPVTWLVSAHRWRVLDLLRPAQAPQQQPSAGPAAAASSSSAGLPPAPANSALPSILQQWANECTSRTQESSVLEPLFQVHSGAPLVAAGSSRSRARAYAAAAAAAGAGAAGEDSDGVSAGVRSSGARPRTNRKAEIIRMLREVGVDDVREGPGGTVIIGGGGGSYDDEAMLAFDDSDDFEEVLATVAQHGQTITRYPFGAVLGDRPSAGALDGVSATGPDRPGTPEQLRRLGARGGGSGRSYGPAPHALRDALTDADDLA